MTSTAETLCASRLPQGAPNRTWKQRMQRGVGAKKRMKEKKPPGAFAVAVDHPCKDGKVSKSFTFFESAADMFRQTAFMSQKNFYELIEPGRWARLYLDIEHYVDFESEPSRVEAAIRVVKEGLLHNWPEKFEAAESAIDDVVVLTASRLVEGAGNSLVKYKHSYHVIFPQIYFYGNTGLMKKFVSSLQDDPRLRARGKQGEPICMVDGNVYHTDQPFRLVESCKFINGPPVGVLRPMDNNQPMTMDDLLRTVVTHDGGGGIRIGEECIGELDERVTESSGRATTKKRPSASVDDSDLQRVSKRRKERDDWISLPPSCVEAFQQMLERAGVRQCDVTGDVLHKDGYAVLPLRNTGPRHCILSPGAIHDSNNAFLTVNDDSVVFKCQSEKCKGMSKCLGGPPRSWQCHRDPVQDEASQGSDMLYELNGDAHATYRYEITHGEILQLLDRLAEVNDLHCSHDSTQYPAGPTSKPQKDIRVRDFPAVASILKRFGYESIWGEWSAKHIHDEAERTRLWRDCGAQKCKNDLNDIVKTVNSTKKKGEPKIPQPERVYFPRPKMSEENSARITHSIDQRFLDQAMFQGRISVVQSATGTGKTTQAVAYAERMGMPILSVCQLRSQVETHVEDFQKKGLSTAKYDDIDALKTFDMGKQSLVTTIDSLPKVKQLIGENIGKYIVLFDEFHSILGYMNFSGTLQQTRREAVKAMRWLASRAGRLIAMDNEITDTEFKFLDDALAGGGAGPYCDLTFIKNDFQKYADVPVQYTADQAKMLHLMLKDIKVGNGFTAPCNTKKQAERIHEQLRQAVVDAGIPVSEERFKVYTSDTQETLPADVDAAWSQNWIIYSPTITTGIDFQPEEPQSVYLFLSGEDTVSPAAALQMITRNRRIKAVYIHATQMRNKPVYASFEHMEQCLDAACLDAPKTSGPSLGVTPCTVANLRGLQDGPHFNKATGEDKYSDSDFSKLYKQALWHDNVMRSAFLRNLDGLLRKRGFDVQRRLIFPQGATDAIERDDAIDVHVVLSTKEADRRSVQAKKDDAEMYLESGPGRRHTSVRCEQTLARMIGIKETERAAMWGEIEHMRICMVKQMRDNPQIRELYVGFFTEPRAVEHYLNLKLAISTDEKLKANANRNAENDFCICAISSSNSRVQLLKELIAAFNREMLPLLHLKTYDLTLKQGSYDETESVDISDCTWARLQHTLAEMRRPRRRPQNRRSLMDCIFILATHLLGKQFTAKKKTRNRASAESATHNVYNYETDQVALGLLVKLMATSHRFKLDDIEPELVCKHDLKVWQGAHA